MSHDAFDPAADAQRALSAHIRDPLRAAAPAGVEERRLRIYRELFFNNVEGILAGNFPVIARTLGPSAWTALVRDFYRDHPSHTPLFTELAREFLRYLETRAGPPRDDPPWLHELAHYEWVELALQISDARVSDPSHDVHDEPLEQSFVLSPLAWPLAYEWPVHRIGPSSMPDTLPGAPTLLLVRRGADGAVRFSELSPLTFRLLQRIEAEPALTGRVHLDALAQESGAPDPDAFVAMGRAMLDQLRADGVLLDPHA